MFAAAIQRWARRLFRLSPRPRGLGVAASSRTAREPAATAPSVMARRKRTRADDIRDQIRAGTAPAGLAVAGKLDLSGDKSLESLPPKLTVGWLDLTDCSSLRQLPPDL